MATQCNFKNMKRFIVFIGILGFIGISSWGQSDGDFLSKQTGDWDDASNWLVYSALDFGYIDASDYPKTNNSTDIIIASNQTITIPGSLTLTNISGHLEGLSSAHLIINGSISLTSSAWIDGGSITNSFPNITVNGTLNTATLCNCTNFIVNDGGKFNTSFYHPTAQSQGWWYNTIAPSAGGSSLLGTIEYSGSTTQNIATLLPYHNLEISTTGTTVSGDLIVNDSLLINSGASLTIASDTDASIDTLIITAANSLILASGSSLIIEGYLTGLGALSVEKQQDITEDTWHLISVPHEGYGMANLLSENTIDQHNTTNEYALADFNEATNQWVTYLNPNKLMNPGQGYFVGVSNPADETLSFTGLPNYGEFSDVLPLGFSNKALNAAGNPYTSSIDVDLFLAHTGNAAAIDDSYNAIYTFDPQSNSYDANVGIIGQDNIQSCQGFMLKADADGGSISFTTSMQTHSTDPFFKKSGQSDNYSLVKINMNSGELNTETSIYFTENSTTGLDPGWDLGMIKRDEKYNLYTHLVEHNGVDFMIQSLPLNDFSDISIPLGIDFDEGGIVNLSASSINLPQDCKLILEDKLLASYTDLKVPNSNYQINLDSETKGTGRFFLHTFDPRTVNIHKDDLENITIFAINKEIIIQGELKANTQLTVYDISGRLILRERLEPNNYNTVQATELYGGVYVVRLESEGKQKVSKVILK